MMAFDHGCVTGTRFNHIGIDCPLNQIIDCPDFLALFLENADKLLADNLAFGFRVGYARKPVQKPLLRINPYKMKIPLFERCFDLIAFIFPHETMIDEHTSQLVPDRFGEQCSGNRGIHAAG